MRETMGSIFESKLCLWPRSAKGGVRCEVLTLKEALGNVNLWDVLLDHFLVRCKVAPDWRTDYSNGYL